MFRNARGIGITHVQPMCVCKCVNWDEMKIFDGIRNQFHERYRTRIASPEMWSMNSTQN